MAQKDVKYNIAELMSNDEKLDALSLKDLDALIKEYPYYAELYQLRSQKHIAINQIESESSFQAGLLHANDELQYIKSIYFGNQEVLNKPTKTKKTKKPYTTPVVSLKKNSAKKHSEKAALKQKEVALDKSKPEKATSKSKLSVSKTDKKTKKKVKVELSKSSTADIPTISDLLKKEDRKITKSNSKVGRTATAKKGRKHLQKKKAKKKRRQSYVQWLKELDGRTPGATDLKSRVDKSIEKNNEIVSEALAKIYKKQGLLEQSINIYKKLSLVYPEKSSFFALQIENLKKL